MPVYKERSSLRVGGSQSYAPTAHEPEAITERSTSPLAPRASSNRAGDWRLALNGSDDALLTNLADKEPPGVALFEMEAVINGLYRKCDLLMREGFDVSERLPSQVDESREVGVGESPRDEVKSPLERARARATRVVTHIERVCRRLSSEIRDFDIQLLRLMRRSSALSPVLGAGVSMARSCGAPSWAAPVRELLRITLEQGLEIRRPEREEASETERDLQTPSGGPMGSEGPDGKCTLSSVYLKQSEPAVTTVYNFKKEKLREHNDDQRRTAQAIIHAIDSGNASNDDLMKGANLTYELCRQDLFTLFTGILYQNERQPSEVHRSIARLAHAQWMPDRQWPGFLPGWDTIVTYNFDNFMSLALEKEGVPSATEFMQGDELVADLNSKAIRLGQVPWLQSVLHLHGHTPQNLFLITKVRFVFALRQYQDTYREQPAEVFRRFVAEYLENPVHVCLYVGCSFTDPYMNRSLQKAIQKWPARYHYALLQWPLKDSKNRNDEKDQKSAERQYIEMGVRPVWFEDYSEIPHISARLE